MSRTARRRWPNWSDVSASAPAAPPGGTPTAIVVPDRLERRYGTNPRSKDSDKDGIEDAVEIRDGTLN